MFTSEKQEYKRMNKLLPDNILHETKTIVTSSKVYHRLKYEAGERRNTIGIIR